jgi:hypothetical protein
MPLSERQRAERSSPASVQWMVAKVATAAPAASESAALMPAPAWMKWKRRARREAAR